MFQVSKHSFGTKVCIFDHFENMLPINALMFFWVRFQWGSLKFKKKYKILMFSEKCMEKYPSGAQNLIRKKLSKKKLHLWFGLNQKFLLYKLWGIVFLTTCIERILDLGQIKVVVFFYSKNLFAKSIVTRSNKIGIIFRTIHPTWLV